MNTLDPRQLASVIDHTFLQPAGDPDAVERLCREAREFGFACAMVNAAEIARAVAALAGSGVRVGTVVDFPLGASTADVKLHAACAAVRAGARDIDYVVDVRKLKRAAREPAVRDELLKELVACDRAPKALADGVVTKLIVECCYLTDDEKRLGAALAKAAGFDFVKTSTGFGTGGATVADVRLLRETVGPDMGVKAAGGIRTLADARAMLAAGATRLGCSAGVKIVRELEAEEVRK